MFDPAGFAQFIGCLPWVSPTAIRVGPLCSQVVVVEACMNLAQPVWSPLQTNTLTSDSLYFSDPQWTNHPARFYRVRSP